MKRVNDIGIINDYTFEKDDLLNRRDFGVSLYNLVKLLGNKGGVIAMDGKRGSGKTYFLKMREDYVRQEGNKVIYYDAFADEYIDDVFLSLSSKLLESTSFASKTKTNFKKSVKSLMPIAGKVFLRYLLRGDIPEIESDTENSIEEDLANYASKIIEDSLEHRAKLENFKLTLKELCKGDQPLVFIVDELDRCKPESIYKLLNSLKHIFNVQNVVFVLGIYKDQINHYLEKVYGKIESDNFLHKFIDLEVTIPQFIGDRSKNGDSVTYFKYLLENDNDLKLLQYKKIDLNDLIRRFADFNSHFHFSLRTVEKIYNYLHIFIINQKFGENTLKILYVILLIVILKIEKIDLYKKIQLGTLSSIEIIKFLGLNQKSHDREISVIQYLFDEEIDATTIERFKSRDFRYNIDRLRIPNFYTNILDILNL